MISPPNLFLEGWPKTLEATLFCATAGVSQVILSRPLDCRGVSYTLLSFRAIGPFLPDSRPHAPPHGLRQVRPVTEVN